MNYIRLTCLNPQNKEHDHVFYLHPDEVRQIHAATPQDRSTRKEINSVIWTPQGAYAVTENPSVIIAKLDSSKFNQDDEDEK